MAQPWTGAGTFFEAEPLLELQFDIFEWHRYFQSCVRYFLDHAQYHEPVQALATFMNIQLPFQKSPNPAVAGGPQPGPAGRMPLGRGQAAQPPLPHSTLIPYIRRLVATGFDYPGVLHGFFGDDWAMGIGPLHQRERQNYLFAAKSETWLSVKTSYDMGDEQTVPFLRPLGNTSEKEISDAEGAWSEWLAMQDWMLGPRAPGGAGVGGQASGQRGRGHGVAIKSEGD